MYDAYHESRPSHLDISISQKNWKEGQAVFSPTQLNPPTTWLPGQVSFASFSKSAGARSDLETLFLGRKYVTWWISDLPVCSHALSIYLSSVVADESCQLILQYENQPVSLTSVYYSRVLFFLSLEQLLACSWTSWAASASYWSNQPRLCASLLEFEYN